MKLSKTFASYAISAINATESVASKATTYTKTKLEKYAKQPSLEEQLELSLDTLETYREKSAIDKDSAHQWLMDQIISRIPK